MSAVCIVFELFQLACSQDLGSDLIQANHKHFVVMKGTQSQDLQEPQTKMRINVMRPCGNLLVTNCNQQIVNVLITLISSNKSRNTADLKIYLNGLLLNRPDDPARCLGFGVEFFDHLAREPPPDWPKRYRCA